MKRLSLLFATIVTITAGLSGQEVSKADLKHLDEYYARMVEDWDIPSAAIGIVKDGELVFAEAYGSLEAGKPGGPDENTLYAIASNSKAFTSAIIGMLVQEGKLDWNDKVNKYLPYFELYDPWVSNEVTIRDLLCHRVGLGTFSGDIIWLKSELSSEEIIRRIRYLPRAFDFRAGWGYSNLMYITAGQIIKEVTGKSWSTNVKERIFDPLEMNRTITSPNSLGSKGNYATPHKRENEINIPLEWVDWEEIGALGGVISSVEDLSKWMIFNLNHGIIGKDTLLTKETRNMVWTPHNNFIVDHTAKDSERRHFSSYGLGWSISEYDGHFSVGHGGAYDGMISSIILIPDEKLGVVVLTNGMKSPARAASNYALDLFLEREPKDWSVELLDKANQSGKEDTRISERIEKRTPGTHPSIPKEEMQGTYYSDIYGKIFISQTRDRMRLEFEHSPDLSASLSHWHYDVWKIEWDRTHAWFNFGTLKFEVDNNLNVSGLEFDVPNDDFFFEELKPYRVEGGIMTPGLSAQMLLEHFLKPFGSRDLIRQELTVQVYPGKSIGVWNILRSFQAFNHDLFCRQSHFPCRSQHDLHEILMEGALVGIHDHHTLLILDGPGTHDILKPGQGSILPEQFNQEFKSRRSFITGLKTKLLIKLLRCEPWHIFLA